MNGLYQAAVEIQQFCKEHNWRFCFIGGLALIRWGEPRQTLDVDLTLLTGFQNERHFVETLLTAFRPRREDALEFALASRVVLIGSATGVPIDVSLGGLPFEEGMIDRSSPFEYLPGASLITASAEDLVILKAFAGRVKDWEDIENIVTRHGETLDWDLVASELAPLCELKESPEVVDRLIKLRDDLAAE